ncbi:hypothetical protein Tco_1204107 [Tanacetum coccineum]
MSIFKVPYTVLRSLELYSDAVFNGHELKCNKSYWVKWNRVVRPAKEKGGGLGVSSLFALNRALLMKWFWRFYSHNDSLWSRVIKAIYGVDGEVNKVSKYASRSCWRDIINEVRKLKDQDATICIEALNEPALTNNSVAAFRGGNRAVSVQGGLRTVYLPIVLIVS